MTGERGVALYLDPASHHFLGDRLFDLEMTPLGGEKIRAPYAALRAYLTERGIPVHTADLLGAGAAGGRKLYVSFGMLDRYRRLARRADTVLSAFIAMECPVVEPSLYRALPRLAPHFKRLLSWSDGESLEPYVGARLHFESFRWPQSFSAVSEPSWSNADRGFLVMINANKLPRLTQGELYTKRLEAIEYFHRYREIDLYGPNWAHMPYRVGKTWMPATAQRLVRALWDARQRVWPIPLYAAAAQASRGPVRSKIETLGRYHFCLCFENMVLKGWTTEKLFDCLFAGTIPVYWGATDVEAWVPPECFVDMRRFRDFGELREFLHGLTQAERSRYREAGRAFVDSPGFRPFSIESFIDLFRRLIREDAGLVV
jgi:hypothetical protein